MTIIDLNIKYFKHFPWRIHNLSYISRYIGYFVHIISNVIIF